MHKIRLYYPKAKRITSSILSLLNYDEINEIRMLILKKWKGDQYDYYKSIENIDRYLVKNFPDKLTKERYEELKKEAKESKENALVLYRKNKDKTTRRKEMEKIERIKKYVGTSPSKPASKQTMLTNSAQIKKDLDHDEVFVIHNKSKRFKIRLNSLTIARIYKSIGIVSEGKYKYDRDDIVTEIKNKVENEYVFVFIKLINKNKITMHEYVDFLPFFMYLIARSFLLDVNKTKYIYIINKNNILHVKMIIGNVELYIIPSTIKKLFNMKFRVHYKRLNDESIKMITFAKNID